MAGTRNDTAKRVLEAQRHLIARFEMDVVQEVVTTILERELDGSGVVDLIEAEKLARELAAKARRSKREIRSADNAEIPDGATPKPVRRSPRAPSIPQGTLSMQVGVGPNETDTPHHVALIQAEVLDPPAPEFLWALSEVFHHLLAPSTRGVWSPPEQQAVALEFYERLFGHKVQQTWVRSYMLLVEEAKRRLLAHRANAALRTKDTQAAAAADGQGLMTPEQLLAHAREITSICPESCRMPAYADDPELVAWLIARMGFEGGGGRSAMTSLRLKELVLDPTALAGAIEQFAARVIGRVSDQREHADGSDEDEQSEAEWGGERLAKLAARVRERGALLKPVSEPSPKHHRPPKHEPRTRNDAPVKGPTKS